MGTKKAFLDYDLSPFTSSNGIASLQFQCYHKNGDSPEPEIRMKYRNFVN